MHALFLSVPSWSVPAMLVAATQCSRPRFEQAALAWLESHSWSVAHGPDIAPDTTGAERADYTEVVLARHLRDALARLNPDLPAAALDDAFRKLTRPEGSTQRADADGCWKNWS